MVFNSLTFVVFFACVLVLHSLPLSWTTKKINLLIASYLFYAAWNPPFVQGYYLPEWSHMPLADGERFTAALYGIVTREFWGTPGAAAVMAPSAGRPQ